MMFMVKEVKNYLPQHGLVNSDKGVVHEIRHFVATMDATNTTVWAIISIVGSLIHHPDRTTHPPTPPGKKKNIHKQIQNTGTSSPATQMIKQEASKWGEFVRWNSFTNLVVVLVINRQQCEKG